MIRALDFIYLVSFALLVSCESSAWAQDEASPCVPVSGGGLEEIRSFVSTTISPLKKAYLNLHRFELDPLSSNLASLENEVDPPQKRMTFTYLVRGDSGAFTKRNPAPELYSNGLIIAPGYNGPGTVTYAANGDFEARSLATAESVNLVELKGLDFKQTLNRLNGLSYFQNENPSQLRLASAYTELMAQSDRAGIEKALSDMKGQLSSQEKLDLSRLVGREAAARFDFERAGLQNHYGMTGLSSSFTGGLAGVAIPYDAVIGNLKSPTTSLGVCRDIAPAQANILHQLGFKNTYVMAYKEQAGAHAAVITQDPDHPGEVLHLNYDSLERRSLQGGTSSLTRSDDYTTRYELYDYKGRPVANLPSSVETMMMEGAGANLRLVDPLLIRPQGSISKISLEAGNAKSKVFQSKMPLFVGRTTDGQNIVGVGNTTRFLNPEEDVIAVTSTVALADQQRNVQDYSNTTYKAEALHFNRQTTKYLNTPWITVKSNQGSLTQVRATGQKTVEHGDIMRRDSTAVETGSDGAPTVTHLSAQPLSGHDQEAARTQYRSFEIGAESRFRSGDQKTLIKLRAATNTYRDSNVSGLQSPTDKAGWVNNVSYVRVTGETAALPNSLKATFDTALGLRVFGSQIFTQAGIQNTKAGWKAQAGYQGALERDALTIAPGSEKQFFVNFEKSISEGLVLSASYMQPVGVSGSAPRIQAGVNGTIPSLKKHR